MKRALSLTPRDKWGPALERALDRSLDDRVSYLFTANGDGCVVTAFEVQSWGEADTRRKVQVFEFNDGRVEAQCTCPASFKPCRCWHIAAALNVAGYLIASDVRSAA